MPKITAHGKTFRDWEGLLGAVERNAAVVTADEPLKTALEKLLAKARDLKVEQEDLQGRSRGATEVLKKTLDEGKETARQLRALVTARLGSKTEMLKQFGIPPGRRRGSRSSKPAEVPPPTAGTAKSEEPPGSPTAPSGKQ
ncbi:MAG: hypothetical protein ACJ76N_24140 [Thermoanaerobaculia bacterium]